MNPLFHLDRRAFLKTAGMATAGLGSATAWVPSLFASHETPDPIFKISVAEWSFHRALQKGEWNNLDFPSVVKEKCGLDAVEYVNTFFKKKAKDRAYLTELKQRCDDLDVQSLLIMVDGEGALGDPEDAKRTQAVENHYPWVEAAKFLGCHSIRVNARSRGSYEEQQKLAADGLRRLSTFGAEHGIDVIVENHGGYSSNGKWLSGVMEKVDHENCGTLPDFGNFRIHAGGEGKPEEWYDRYQGVRELMPYAQAVSAKSHQFDDDGNEVKTDYTRMMKIVLDAGYHGYVGIEWEGGSPGELEGTLLTKKLLERVREALTPEYRLLETVPS